MGRILPPSFIVRELPTEKPRRASAWIKYCCFRIVSAGTTCVLPFNTTATLDPSGRNKATPT